jgi:hypothetical protein
MMSTPNGHPPAPARPTPPRPALEVRVAALQAVATFAAGVVLGTSKPLSSQDVLRVVEAFERWLLGQER